MNFMINLLNILLPVFYLVLTYLYGRHFYRSDRASKLYLGKLLQTVLAIHLLEIVLRGIYFNHFPLASIFEAMTFLALTIIIIYWYIERRIQIKTTGFFVLIVVFILQLISSIFIELAPEIPEILNSPMFVFHTSSAMLGYSALFISALYGLMYLLLFYDIKSAQFGIVYRRLPSLEELNEMSTRAAMLGFLFLTLTIFLGITWWKGLFPEAYHFDPKVVTAYLVWIIYGLVIYGKKFGGWTGKRLAYLSLSGFVIIIFSIIAVNLFIDTFHRFK